MELELFPKWLFNLYLIAMFMAAFGMLWAFLSLAFFPSFFSDRLDAIDEHIKEETK